MHLGILIGGILAPEYFLFPLGLFYMVFGVARATVLGLMERPEPAPAVDEQLPIRRRRRYASAAATPIERRAGWVDRRQEPEDR